MKKVKKKKLERKISSLNKFSKSRIGVVTLSLLTVLSIAGYVFTYQRVTLSHRSDQPKTTQNIIQPSTSSSSNFQDLNPVTGQPTTQNSSQSNTSSGSSNPISNTPTPTPSNKTSGSTATTTPSYTYKPYVPYSCTKTPVPYKTTYVNNSSLYVGETKEVGGYDGYKNTCTADSTGYKPADYISQPIDKTVFVGTAVKTSSSTPTYTYEQALYIAQHTGACMIIAQASGTGSSAYQYCISIVLKDYGY